FLFAENLKYVGKWEILDIGLDKEFIENSDSKNVLIEGNLLSNILIKRGKYSHKGTYGHSLMIMGSRGKMGAAVIAGLACLKSGSGLVSFHIPNCGYQIIQTSLPEAMCYTDENENIITKVDNRGVYDAIAIGPGIGTDSKTQGMLKLLIQNQNSPMVLDADALNILAKNKTWLAFLPKGSILTPHPGEFERLAGNIKNDHDKFEKQKKLAQDNGIYIVLKGAHTSIATPDGYVFFNNTGNPGMATAGSGDALTGIICGLMAQGYNSRVSSLLGVYLHGTAGDVAAYNHGMESMTTRDLIYSLGNAFSILKNN
ncbi:MAG: NAD(P)H-hydrate dehydratase, partial [Flavobacteriales bacterium]